MRSLKDLDPKKFKDFVDGIFDNICAGVTPEEYEKMSGPDFVYATLLLLYVDDEITFDGVKVAEPNP